MPRKKQLGEVLKESNLITKEQLQEALRVQKQTGGRLGQVLVNLGYVTEQDILNVLEFQLGIEQVDLKEREISPDVQELVPEALVRRYQLLPVARDGNVLKIAMADPLNVIAIDDVRMATGLEVQPLVASETDINQLIDDLYGPRELVDNNFDFARTGAETAAAGETFNLDEFSQELADEAPVVRLVNSILNQAVQKKASDIHIEPQEEKVRVRLRIDGLLRKLMELPKQVHPFLVARIKIMAQMDIAEKRLPQDGRVQVRVPNREIDLRISTLPTIFGEKVVLRILDKSQVLLSLGKLGFLPDQQKRFEGIIRSSHGMILVTGPTGSGKTTTLYATLNEINTPDKNIITIEDPVEYVLKDINQIQVNAKSGLTFATGLRSILRQDPDVIMVGEIRDRETAEIAVRAATTGHLVLSTLHTNDAVGTVTRLIDMGIEPYLVASSVVGIVAQRLVRRICPRCRTAYRLDRDDPACAFMGLDAAEPVQLYKGKGCRYCDHTGFKGRLAIQEVLPITKALRDLINNGDSGYGLHDTAKAQGMATLKEDGIEKARQGLTTIHEVMRVAYMDES